MFEKMVCDLSFLSSLLGFLGMLIVTGYAWHLGRKVDQVKLQENKKVEAAASSDKSEAQLRATQVIDAAENDKNTYSSKISNRVFIILILSFGLATGGMIVSKSENSELKNRVKKIESYLWPPPGGGTGQSLSEQIDAANESLANISRLQSEIVETIYKRVKSPSADLLEKVEQMNQEIIALKQRIEYLQRQQDGQVPGTM